jgi:hypothetical protein
MPQEYPFADEAGGELQRLKEKGKASRWIQSALEELFQAFARWMKHPQFLDPNQESRLRVTVLNEITFLISEPIVGNHAWEYIRGVARELGQDDPHDLRESLRIATLELAAEPPDVPDFLEKLFSLAGDKDTRWAVFAAYENVPWRLRPHAHKYSAGQITDEDCDRWLVDEGWGEDEFLMRKAKGEQGVGGQPATPPQFAD